MTPDETAAIRCIRRIADRHDRKPGTRDALLRIADAWEDAHAADVFYKSFVEYGMRTLDSCTCREGQPEKCPLHGGVA